MNESKVPLVSICCAAYNHEPYIRQCLDGFVMQRTTFPFEVLIHDDASTDKTADIIREYEKKYPDIIKPIYQKENQYSKGGKISLRFNIPRAKGKYIAFCEGDDYWIDPLKLQKQVDFLEANPDYGLVCTDVDFYIQAEDRFIRNYFQSKKYPIKYTFEDFLVKAWFVATCTWLYQKELCEEMSRRFDIAILLEISSKKKIKYIDDVTAVYRVRSSSASHHSGYSKANKFYESVLETQLFYAKKTGNEKLVPQIMRQWYMTMIKVSIKYKAPWRTVAYYVYKRLFCWK